MDKRFFITNVFSSEKYSGSGLVTVILSSEPEDDVLKKIAMEFPLADTAFVIMPRTKSRIFRLRIFSSGREISFAGHPLIGSAQVIWEQILKKSGDLVSMELNDSSVTVGIEPDKDLFWIVPDQPASGITHDRDSIGKILGLTPEDIIQDLPVLEIASGKSFIIIPAVGLMSLRNARLNMELYDHYFKNRERLPLYIYSTRTYRMENSINARVFARHSGIPEDPASGSGAACLGAYLRLYSSPHGNIDVTIEQGHEIHRSSIIHLRVTAGDNEDEFTVGGRVTPIAEGRLL